MIRRYFCVSPEVWQLPINLCMSEGAYLVHLNCLYLIKLMVVGFCSRSNWTVGSSIKAITDLILFHYQTATKYTINFNYQHIKKF